MKKTIKQFLLVFLVGLMSITFLTSSARISEVKNKTQSTLKTETTTILEYYIGGSNNPKLDNTKKDLSESVIPGINSTEVLGMYVDTAQDGQEFEGENTKSTAGSNGGWYDNTITSFSDNYLNYADSKEDFLNKYQYVTINLLASYNVWNSWYGWGYPGGKFRPMSYESLRFQLTGENEKETLLLSKADPREKDPREYVEIRIHEEWTDNNILNIKLGVYASVYWSPGSRVHHSALIRILGPQFSFASDGYSPNIPDELLEINKDNDLNQKGETAGVELNILSFFSIPWGEPGTISTNKLLTILYNLKDEKDYKAVISLDQTMILTGFATEKIGNRIRTDTYIILLHFPPLTWYSHDINMHINSDWPENELYTGDIEYVIDYSTGISYFRYVNKWFGYRDITNPIFYEPDSLALRLPVEWVGIGFGTYYYEEKEQEKNEE